MLPTSDLPFERSRLSYRLLQAWARSAARIVYRRIDVDGREHLPESAPVILAANHSNALADIAVIVAKVPKFPHFLASTAWWKHWSARTLFGWGGVLPVRRAGDPPGPLANHETFDACYLALSEHETIAIFPEGIMHDDGGLLPLKHGAARIGLGAANLGVRDVVIIPIGLVYEDRGRFRSDAVVRFGKPIAMDDWLTQFGEDERETVRSVTAQLTEELAQVIEEPPQRRDRDSRAQVEMLLLTPAAAVGAVAHAPLLVAGIAANGIRDDMWRASAKGVAGTLLLPLTYATELWLLTRRYGLRRALTLTGVGAVSGVATVAWIDRRRDARRQREVLGS